MTESSKSLDRRAASGTLAASPSLLSSSQQQQQQQQQQSVHQHGIYNSLLSSTAGTTLTEMQQLEKSVSLTAAAPPLKLAPPFPGNCPWTRNLPHPSHHHHHGGGARGRGQDNNNNNNNNMAAAAASGGGGGAGNGVGSWKDADPSKTHAVVVALCLGRAAWDFPSDDAPVGLVNGGAVPLLSVDIDEEAERQNRKAGGGKVDNNNNNESNNKDGGGGGGNNNNNNNNKMKKPHNVFDLVLGNNNHNNAQNALGGVAFYIEKQNNNFNNNNAELAGFLTGGVGGGDQQAGGNHVVAAAAAAAAVGGGAGGQQQGGGDGGGTGGQQQQQQQTNISLQQQLQRTQQPTIHPPGAPSTLYSWRALRAHSDLAAKSCARAGEGIEALYLEMVKSKPESKHVKVITPLVNPTTEHIRDVLHKGATDAADEQHRRNLSRSSVSSGGAARGGNAAAAGSSSSAASTASGVTAATTTASSSAASSSTTVAGAGGAVYTGPNKILLHYVGHGVPRPERGCMFFTRQATQRQHHAFTPVRDILHLLGTPCMLLCDCASAGNIRSALIAVERELNPYSITRENRFFWGSCGDGEALPHHALMPDDLFSSIMLSPIRMAVLFFIVQRKNLYDFPPYLIHCFANEWGDARSIKPGSAVAEVRNAFNAIVESIVAKVLAPDVFYVCFRQDTVVMSLFRAFVLAQRIIGTLGLEPCSHPHIPPETQSHPLWQSFDFVVEGVLGSIMRAWRPKPSHGLTTHAFRMSLDPTLVVKNMPEIPAVRATSFFQDSLVTLQGMFNSAQAQALAASSVVEPPSSQHPLVDLLAQSDSASGVSGGGPNSESGASSTLDSNSNTVDFASYLLQRGGGGGAGGGGDGGFGSSIAMMQSLPFSNYYASSANSSLSLGDSEFPSRELISFVGTRFPILMHAFVSRETRFFGMVILARWLDIGFLAIECCELFGLFREIIWQLWQLKPVEDQDPLMVMIGAKTCLVDPKLLLFQKSLQVPLQYCARVFVSPNEPEDPQKLGILGQAPTQRWFAGATLVQCILKQPALVFSCLIIQQPSSSSSSSKKSSQSQQQQQQQQQQSPTEQSSSTPRYTCPIASACVEILETQIPSRRPGGPDSDAEPSIASNLKSVCVSLLGVLAYTCRDLNMSNPSLAPLLQEFLLPSLENSWIDAVANTLSHRDSTPRIRWGCARCLHVFLVVVQSIRDFHSNSPMFIPPPPSNPSSPTTPSTAQESTTTTTTGGAGDTSTTSTTSSLGGGVNEQQAQLFQQAYRVSDRCRSLSLKIVHKFVSHSCKLEGNVDVRREVLGALVSFCRAHPEEMTSLPLQGEMRAHFTGTPSPYKNLFLPCYFNPISAAALKRQQQRQQQRFHANNKSNQPSHLSPSHKQFLGAPSSGLGGGGSSRLSNLTPQQQQQQQAAYYSGRQRSDNLDISQMTGVGVGAGDQQSTPLATPAMSAINTPSRPNNNNNKPGQQQLPLNSAVSREDLYNVSAMNSQNPSRLDFPSGGSNNNSSSNLTPNNKQQQQQQQQQQQSSISPASKATFCDVSAETTNTNNPNNQKRGGGRGGRYNFNRDYEDDEDDENDDYDDFDGEGGRGELSPEKLLEPQVLTLIHAVKWILSLRYDSHPVIRILCIRALQYFVGDRFITAALFTKPNLHQQQQQQSQSQTSLVGGGGDEQQEIQSGFGMINPSTSTMTNQQQQQQQQNNQQQQQQKKSMFGRFTELFSSSSQKQNQQQQNQGQQSQSTLSERGGGGGTRGPAGSQIQSQQNYQSYQQQQQHQQQNHHHHQGMQQQHQQDEQQAEDVVGPQDPNELDKFLFSDSEASILFDFEAPPLTLMEFDYFFNTYNNPSTSSSSSSHQYPHNHRHSSSQQQQQRRGGGGSSTAGNFNSTNNPTTSVPSDNYHIVEFVYEMLRSLTKPVIPRICQRISLGDLPPRLSRPQTTAMAITQACSAPLVGDVAPHRCIFHSFVRHAVAKSKSAKHDSALSDIVSRHNYAVDAAHIVFHPTESFAVCCSNDDFISVVSTSAREKRVLSAQGLDRIMPNGVEEASVFGNGGGVGGTGGSYVGAHNSSRLAEFSDSDGLTPNANSPGRSMATAANAAAGGGRAAGGGGVGGDVGTARKKTGALVLLDAVHSHTVAVVSTDGCVRVVTDVASRSGVRLATSFPGLSSPFGAGSVAPAGFQYYNNVSSNNNDIFSAASKSAYQSLGQRLIVTGEGSRYALWDVGQQRKLEERNALPINVISQICCVTPHAASPESFCIGLSKQIVVTDYRLKDGTSGTLHIPEAFGGGIGCVSIMNHPSSPHKLTGVSFRGCTCIWDLRMSLDTSEQRSVLPGYAGAFSSANTHSYNYNSNNNFGGGGGAGTSGFSSPSNLNNNNATTTTAASSSSSSSLYQLPHGMSRNAIPRSAHLPGIKFVKSGPSSSSSSSSSSSQQQQQVYSEESRVQTAAIHPLFADSPLIAAAVGTKFKVMLSPDQVLASRNEQPVVCAWHPYEIVGAVVPWTNNEQNKKLEIFAAASKEQRADHIVNIL